MRHEDWIRRAPGFVQVSARGMGHRSAAAFARLGSGLAMPRQDITRLQTRVLDMTVAFIADFAPRQTGSGGVHR